MRCAVNATTEKGPRVALRSVLSAGRCAASCGVPLQIGRRRRRKEIGLLPSFPRSLLARLAFLTAPPLTVHLSSRPAPFSSGTGTEWARGKKGSIEMSGETNCSTQCVIFGPLSI